MAQDCPRIVVIEDDPDIRESIQDMLEFEGYSVRSFENGQAAIDGLMDCQDPCLILLDLMMPVMNGWQFLEARKHISDQITAIPVVIVSAFTEKARETEGVSGYIKKPVDIDVLLAVVKSHCVQGCKAA